MRSSSGSRAPRLPASLKQGTTHEMLGIATARGLCNLENSGMGAFMMDRRHDAYRDREWAGDYELVHRKALNSMCAMHPIRPGQCGVSMAGSTRIATRRNHRSRSQAAVRCGPYKSRP